MAKLPDGDFLIGDQQGTLYRAGQGSDPAEVGTVTGLSSTSDGGLIGLAVQESSSEEGVIIVHVFYTDSATTSRIGSYRYIPDPELGQVEWNRAQTTVLQNIPYSSTTHNGGALAFGPDGMLYAGTGDTGDPGLAEDADSYAGKILRIDPDTGYPPDDNPDQDSYVYSSGHTDVEGLAWDGADRLWAVDGTELNAIAPGGDYANQQDPVYDWSSSGSGSGSTVEPTGLAYDEGSRSLWMTSQTDSGIWRIPLNGQDGLVEGAEPELLADSNGQIAELHDILPGTSGQLLVLTGESGSAVLRLTVT